MAIGNYERALAVSEEGLQLQLNPSYKAGLLNNIAEVYYRQGRLPDARVKCEESLVISRYSCSRIQEGVTLHLIGKICFSQCQYNEALKYVQEATAIFKAAGSWYLSEAEKTLHQIQKVWNGGFTSKVKEIEDIRKS